MGLPVRDQSLPSLRIARMPSSLGWTYTGNLIFDSSSAHSLASIGFGGEADMLGYRNIFLSTGDGNHFNSCSVVVTQLTLIYGVVEGSLVRTRDHFSKIEAINEITGTIIQFNINLVLVPLLRLGHLAVLLHSQPVVRTL